jgi:hypothetical protein
MIKKETTATMKVKITKRTLKSTYVAVLFIFKYNGRPPLSLNASKTSCADDILNKLVSQAQFNPKVSWVT